MDNSMQLLKLLFTFGMFLIAFLSLIVTIVVAIMK